MHQTQWGPERPLPPPVSLASQSHHEKPPEVTCTSPGNPGFPASTRKSPRLFSVYFYRVSAVVCLYLQRDIMTFPGYLWGTSVILPQHKVLTTSTFLQEHRYEITLVASSSKKIHLTYSPFFDKRQFLRCCYRGQIQTRISGP